MGWGLQMFMKVLGLVSYMETSLKWLTVAMPLLETFERLERDWRETGERQERDKRETGERLERDRRETGKRLERDWRVTKERD